MNLKSLSDDLLLKNTLSLVQEERHLLTKILHHLREVERRRLFSKLKYQSLFEYAVHELKYSESQASRRISAMRLLREIPEIEEKISEGSLSLTNLSLAQIAFKKERKSGRALNTEEKKIVLMRLENQPKREALRLVHELSPSMKLDSKKLSYDRIEDQALREKLLKLKGLYAHSHPDMDLEELLHKLSDMALKKHAEVTPAEKNKGVSSATSPSLAPAQLPKPISQAEVRRRVWRRDRSRCTNCRSTYALQIDHIRPRAMGGKSTLDNMRLLCRNCNLRAAVEKLGMRKMGTHLKATTIEYQTRHSLH